MLELNSPEITRQAKALLAVQQELAPANKDATPLLEQFQFEMLRISNHTACRFAEKARFFRSLWAGRRCAAASHFTFFKGEML